MATKERREELINRIEPLGPISEGWIMRLKDDKCPMCGHIIDPNEFRDDLSRKEFDISHMCQKCQDEIFSESP
jgi:hypothetical protein